MLRHLVFYRNLLKTFNFIDSFIIVSAIKLNFSKIFLPVKNVSFFIRKNTKDKETFKEIFNSKIYQCKLPIIPKTIIDAGANVGFASIFFKSKYKNSEILALEIETENCTYFEKNMKKFENIELLQKGLYNKKVKLIIEDPFNATNSYIIKEVNDHEKYMLESITIDDILAYKKWDTIDLLKIDIEGAEKNVFESNYENWLPKTKIIMIETHDRIISKCSYNVMKAINNFNFILYTTNEGTLIYYNMDYINKKNMLGKVK